MIRKLKNYYHFFCAVFANIYYYFPSKKICVVGVTGTDGKTTTTNLIYSILKESGKQVAMISTNGAVIDNKIHDTGFHVTTPSSFSLQRYIRKAVNGKNEYLLLEVTSHGLDQNRVSGINFEIGVLTNVTHEHLDYHKTYDNYVKTKMKLLEMAKISILNRDDESYEIINSKFKIQSSKSQLKNKKIITYGLNNNSDINPNIFPFKTNLIGEFNKYNCLAAIAVCRQLGIRDEVISKAVLSFNSPVGRQDVVYNKDFKVMIDFAHTPNAFAKLLPQIRGMTKNKLIHVFGLPSKRDVSKRPLMGKISSEYSDVIVLTSEDPRGEDVNKIIDEIALEIPNSKFQTLNKSQIENTKYKILNTSKHLVKILDRKEAIKFAISIAEKGDFVLLTGKGHEKSMNYNGKEEPWDEYAVANDAIKRRHNTQETKNSK